MLDLILMIAQIAGAITGIAAAVVLLIKPLRERVIGMKEIAAAQRCLLRQSMLNTYYRHKTEDKLRQYEYENFLYLYTAYKAMGGNSFIDKIKAEVDAWEVET